MPARTKRAATGKKGRRATANKGQQATRRSTPDPASDAPAVTSTSTPDTFYEPLGPPPHRRTSQDGAGAFSDPFPNIPSTPPRRPRVFDENSPPVVVFNTFERNSPLSSRLSPSSRTPWASDAGLERFSHDGSPVIRQGRYEPPSPLQDLPLYRTPENMDTGALLEAFYGGPSTPTRASHKKSPGILESRGDRRTQKASEEAAVGPPNDDPFVIASQDAAHLDVSVTVEASDAPVDDVEEKLINGEEKDHNEAAGESHEDDVDAGAPAHGTKEDATDIIVLPTTAPVTDASSLTTVIEPTEVRGASPLPGSLPALEPGPSKARATPKPVEIKLLAPRPAEGHVLEGELDGTVQHTDYQQESSDRSDHRKDELPTRRDEVVVPYDQARSRRKRTRSRSKDGERDDQASLNEDDKRRRVQKRLRKEQDGHVQAGPVAPGTLRSPRAYSMAAAEQQQPEDVQDARDDAHASAPRLRTTTRPPLHDDEAQHRLVSAHAPAPVQLPPPPPHHQQQHQQQQSNYGPAPFAQAPAQCQLQQAPGFVYNPHPFEVYYPQLGYGVYYPPGWYDSCILPNSPFPVPQPQGYGVQNAPLRQWAPQHQLHAHHSAHTHSVGAHQMPLADQVVQGAQLSVAAPQQPQLASTTQPAAPAAAQPTPAAPATLSFANGAPPAVHPPPAGILCKWHARCTYVFDTSLSDDDLKAAVQKHFETEIKGKWVEVQEPGRRRRREQVEVGLRSYPTII
uniref:Uncharacterized protein n=1 Tax=Schizophyllum commune (strain H4-8 / FGSC 9210) TaxID=578458 RepID=D8Q301_SCHCM